jgi:acyl carrier protein
VKERVFKVVSQVMDVPADEINEESSPDTIEAWDSLKHMNLVLALEEEFGVQFTDEQIMEMLSVALIIEIVKEAT